MTYREQYCKDNQISDEEFAVINAGCPPDKPVCDSKVCCQICWDRTVPKHTSQPINDMLDLFYANKHLHDKIKTKQRKDK